MLITRASRREHGDIREFYSSQDWGDDVDVGAGVSFVARRGPILGAVRLVEVDPTALVVEDVVVHKNHRRKGIGRQLMRAAMNSRGGSLYVACHDDVIAFYEKFGFATADFETLPASIQSYFESTGEYPSEPGHEQYFLRAR